MRTAAEARQFDRLELAALAYLLAPMAPFLWGWWRWPVALLATGLLALMVHAVLQRRQRGANRLPLRLWLLLAVVAVLWVAASGLLGGLPLNEDWSVRMRVLRDLTVGAWPVGYGALDGGQAVLRFSMGFYLVPAGLGAAFGGVDAARLLMGLWTVLGVMLFFALVLQAWPSRRPAGAARLLALLVLFSGMDILGFLVGRAHVPELGEHIEWWTPWLQYSSQTTLLFWVPNHALTAWLGACIAWRHRDSGLAAAPAALLLVAAALWSPLACVGLLPLLALACWHGRPLRDVLAEGLGLPVLAALPLLGLLAAFVSFGIVIDALPADLRGQAGVATAPARWYQWLTFELLEWGLPAAALASRGVRRQGWAFWAACGMLLVLPALRFGPGNDLVMRAGIAPLTVLLLCIAQTLYDRRLEPRWHQALLLMLVLGCATPAQEFIRQAQPGSRWPDDGRNVVQALGTPWHYVGVLRPGWLAQLLRAPVPAK